MREATGELNMSLVVITLVAGLLAFFYAVIWPNIDKNQEDQANCSKAVCYKDTLNDSAMVRCEYKDKNGSTKSIWCKYKG